MNLAPPPQDYDQSDEAQLRRAVMVADAQNRKRGENVELRRESLILPSPNGTRWAITVSDLGALTATAL